MPPGEDMAAVTFNPFEPGFIEDPYSRYAALREHEPVHQSPLGFWMLFRYEDVHGLLRDRLSVEDRNAGPNPIRDAMREIAGDRVDRGNRAMLNLDPPDHTRLRRLVSKAFTPRMIEKLRARVQELVDEALDQAEARGEMDVISDLAFPLPFTVISEMLGMPETNRDDVRDWSGKLVRTLDPVPDPSFVQEIMQAGDAMRDHVLGVIEQKRANLADDLLSGLIAAEDEGDVLSEEELLAQVMLLYIAGHETTVNLIGNGTLALLRNRDQLERLVADPALDANAVEELLRYDSPVQVSRRITLDKMEIGGRTISKGSFVATCLASANRDPARFGDDADRLDLGRADANAHVSFGGGVHHCLGANLARMEGQVAIGTLVRRFPSIEPAGEPEWNGRVNLRGLSRLPVALC